MVTSTAPGEGKTTIAASLAQAFALSEEKVLIIDADLRKPRLHKIINMNGNSGQPLKGLSQYLSGICEVDDIIHKTAVPNLFFINSGPTPPNPADLLASSRMRTLLETMGQRFDRIILDAPPATGFGDVLVLGNYSDGILFVSTLGQTHRESLRVFQKRLSTVRGHLIGCIINKLNISSHYGGGYYYRYYSYYSSGGHEIKGHTPTLPLNGKAMQEPDDHPPENSNGVS